MCIRDSIISSPIVKETIINNADCKILLDQRKYMTKFDGIQAMLGLSEKEKAQILSLNLARHPGRNYKAVSYTHLDVYKRQVQCYERIHNGTMT